MNTDNPAAGIRGNLQDVESEPGRFERCLDCGQWLDRHDFAEVLHHGTSDHPRLPVH